MDKPIETQRLIIRPFTVDDVEGVFEFGSNPDVARYTGDKVITKKEQALETIQNIWLKEYETYGYARWAVIYKPDNKLIGFAGFKYLSEFEETDIGYRFLPEYWGQGIGTEAGKAILDYGFNQLRLKRIIGIAIPDNMASCRILEKLGMQLYQKKAYDEGGEICNWYVIEQE